VVWVDAAGDKAVAAVARLQRGLISREQLRAMGLGRGAIEHRLASGRLHRVRRGVYQVGHSAAPPLAREIAALLAYGPGSVLSHRTAAVQWRILPPADGPVSVTILGRDGGRRPGVRRHRVQSLGAVDLRLRDGVPLTAPARTLLDLAGEADDRDLGRAINEALVQRLVSTGDLRSVLERCERRPGSPILRRLVDKFEEPALTRSEAEVRMLELLRRSGLPSPETNVRVGRYEVDMLWRQDRLVVEIDGFAFHSTRAAFERDRRRDADLQTAGLRVMRVTWRQIVEEPEATLVRVARLLGVRTAA
jgi:very-short-patch-repair endonuclease